MGSGVSTETGADFGALVDAVKNPDVPKEERLRALKRLEELTNSNDEAYKVDLARDEVGLLKELASLLAKEREPGGDSEAVLHACRICWYMSRSGAAGLNLVSPSNNLLPVLVTIAGAGLGEVYDYCFCFRVPPCFVISISLPNLTFSSFFLGERS